MANFHFVTNLTFPGLSFSPQLKMKPLAVFSLASAVAQAYAASPEAHVYLSDSGQQHHTKPPSISPHEARLLLAQRLGLSSYHSLGDASDSALERLNIYGGAQKELFHEEQWQSPNLLLAVVEGVEHPEGMLIGDALRPQKPLLNAGTRGH